MTKYERLQRDPDSVDAEGRALFDHRAPIDAPLEPVPTDTTIAVRQTDQQPSARQVERITRLSSLARKIRGRGHLAAQIDPLDRQPPGDRGLDLSACGVTPEDLLELPASVVDGPVAKDAPNAGAAIEALFAIYCGTTGYDYGHIQVAEERTWLRDAAETGRYRQPLTEEEQRKLFERLTEVEAFERFLHRSLPGQKRFSIEGNDLLIPMLDTVIRGAAIGGIREVVMGMAHRGRLNVLAHVLGKPYAAILAEFHAGAHGSTTAPTEHFTHYGWTGDVKYHLGARKTLAEGSPLLHRAEQGRIVAEAFSGLQGPRRAVQGVARHAG